MAKRVITIAETRSGALVSLTDLVESANPLVEVITVKVADRGDGIIVRLRNWATPGPPHPLTLRVTPAARPPPPRSPPPGAPTAGSETSTRWP